MKVRLLYSDRDIPEAMDTPPWAEAMWTDLELQKISDAMSCGDQIIADVVHMLLLHPLTQAEEILRRQAVIQDSLDHPQAVRELYGLLNEILDGSKKDVWWLSANLPSTRFSSSVGILKDLHAGLCRLRDFADKNEGKFRSAGFCGLFQEVKTQLDDDFLRESRQLLHELEFRDGMTVELTLDREQRGMGYHLVRETSRGAHLRWALAPGFSLAERDETGARDLSSRRDLAQWSSAGLLHEAAGHIEQFLRTLRRETAFCMGTVRLRACMAQRNIPCCTPQPDSRGAARSFRNLQDLSLALRIDSCVGNDLDAENKLLYVVTGANQGGKTTFLRSLGQAQLMFQCGLFTAADRFSAHICPKIFTHFNREEDRKLHSGKLDEELRRLDAVVPELSPGALLLCNESFSSTNEREGSEICRQITAALLEHHIEQVHVTHLYTFAHQLAAENRPGVMFLRAERLEDGTRSYRIKHGLPEQTAYGRDLYRAVWDRD